MASSSGSQCLIAEKIWQQQQSLQEDYVWILTITDLGIKELYIYRYIVIQSSCLCLTYFFDKGTCLGSSLL